MPSLGIDTSIIMLSPNEMGSLVAQDAEQTLVHVLLHASTHSAYIGLIREGRSGINPHIILCRATYHSISIYPYNT